MPYSVRCESSHCTACCSQLRHHAWMKQFAIDADESPADPRHFADRIIIAHGADIEDAELHAIPALESMAFLVVGLREPMKFFAHAGDFVELGSLEVFERWFPNVGGFPFGFNWHFSPAAHKGGRSVREVRG